MRVEHNGVGLHVEVRGPEDAPCVLLLHGFTGSGESWGQVAAELAKRWRVVTLDLVGHGASDAPRDLRAYSMDACVAQACAVLHALGVEQAHWAGYSMGGRVALHAALEFPGRVASLALVSASAGLEAEEERAERRAMDQGLADLAERDLELFVDAWMAQPLFASEARFGDAWLEERRARRLEHHAHGLANSLRGMGQGTAPHHWERLRDVRCPALLVSGARDARYTAIMRRMAKAMPRTEHVVVPDAGHAVHEEAPATLAHALVGFMEEASGA